MTHSGKPCDEPGEHRQRGYCTGLTASSVNHRRRTTTCVTLTFNAIPALGKDFSLVMEKAEALDGQRRRKLLCCTRRERREPWTSYHRQRYPVILSLSPPLICRHNVLPSCDIFQLHWSVTLLLCSNNYLKRAIGAFSSSPFCLRSLAISRHHCASKPVQWAPRRVLHERPI